MGVGGTALDLLLTLGARGQDGRGRRGGGRERTSGYLGEAEELSSHDVYHTQHPAPSPDRGGFMYHMRK